MAVTPPSLGLDAFVDAYNATLYVPVESIEDYRSTEGWKDFFAIEAITYLIEVDGIYYIKTSDNTLCVTYKDENYNSYSGNIVIPSSVTFEGKTYQVTEIGEYAFSFSGNLTSVSIPSSVTRIGDCAFQECRSLSYISIPNSVEEIGNHAFDYAGLIGVSIGSAVKRIGVNAFSGCQFTTLTLPEGLLTIEDNAFSECSMMKSINLPGTLTSIGDNAFDLCSSLTSVTIPESVTHIGNEAFEECYSLISMKVVSGNEVYDSRNNCNAIIETATNTLITGCKKSNIPNTVTNIGDYAFALCGGIESISIPSSVEIIGKDAFIGCSNLKSISIGSNVTSIGECAFLDCEAITRVTCFAPVPPSMFSMECFSYCVYDNAVLRVPRNSLEQYVLSENWSEFLNIEGISKGDANGDGNVNISDVTALIDYLLSGNPSGVDVNSADCNNDGNVNISDVTALIDYLLSGHWPDEPVIPTDNHEYVDLGLPSGTLWATMNIGANSPEDFGDYFAWGETVPKDYYDWSNYKWCNGSDTTMTKYCTLSEYGNNGFIDNKTELDPEDDAAYVNWGSLWRMPSKAQIDELNLECTWRWTQRNGVNGLLVTGTNGNSMFLPAAGGRWYELLCDVDNWGFYWSRTLHSGDPYFAFDLYFDSGKVYWDMDGHYAGFTVRAVRVTQN